MKAYASELTKNREECFEWLPIEQQLTEKSLIDLERKIARASAKNERVLTESMLIAQKDERPID